MEAGDRPSQADDRQVQARQVRSILRARRAISINWSSSSRSWKRRRRKHALAAEAAAVKAGSIPVKSFEREEAGTHATCRAHLPRERVVIPAPCSCPVLRRQARQALGEDITGDARSDSAPVEGHPDGKGEVLLPVFARPSRNHRHQFYPIARGRAGAGLLADDLFHGKFGNHLRC